MFLSRSIQLIFFPNSYPFRKYSKLSQLVKPIFGWKCMCRLLLNSFIFFVFFQSCIRLYIHLNNCLYRSVYLGEIEGQAPVPSLGVGVRQGGNLVTGELNVSPGTALQMEIFIDEESAPIYGLLVTFMQVTDTKSQEETIIFNG